jgi:hypothetical protein
MQPERLICNTVGCYNEAAKINYGAETVCCGQKPFKKIVGYVY